MGDAADLEHAVADLAGEHTALDEVVAALNEGDWHSPTPAAGWNVTDQIGHLTYFDASAALAITDANAFAAHVTALVAAAVDGGGDETTLGAFRALAPADGIARWRANRASLLAAAGTLSPNDRVPWYGPSMSAQSFVGARIMETWAHGTDVASAVGATLVPSDRLYQVARLGFLTRGWSYAVRGLPVPATTVALTLVAPSGTEWTFGRGTPDDTVTGPAADFCLVVTQRCHLDDTALSTGPIGRDWLTKAQAFAGGPTDPPAPRRRR